METLSALLALCEGNAPVTGGFPAQRPVAWSFDASFLWSSPEQMVQQTVESAGDLRRHYANYDAIVMSFHAWLSCFSHYIYWNYTFLMRSGLISETLSPNKTANVKGYIITTFVCSFCLSACVSVCLTFLFNELPRLHFFRYWLSFCN